MDLTKALQVIIADHVERNTYTRETARYATGENGNLYRISVELFYYADTSGDGV